MTELSRVELRKHHLEGCLAQYTGNIRRSSFANVNTGISCGLLCAFSENQRVAAFKCIADGECDRVSTWCYYTVEYVFVL